MATDRRFVAGQGPVIRVALAPTISISSMVCFGCCGPVQHWHDLPERYGKYKTAHKRFTRWAKAGVWERVFAQLLDDPANDYVSLDSSLVRAHQQAGHRKGRRPKRGDQALGRSRRRTDDQDPHGRGCPRPTAEADPYTRPARRCAARPGLLEGLSPRRVLADKAYDSNALRGLIASMGAEAVIPCNPTRKNPIPYDFEAYKIRNTIERCFNKLKHFRRIATRFDRRAKHFLSFLQLAAAMLWMR
jgi:transposase